MKDQLETKELVLLLDEITNRAANGDKEAIQYILNRIQEKKPKRRRSPWRAKIKGK